MPIIGKGLGTFKIAGALPARHDFIKLALLGAEEVQVVFYHLRTQRRPRPLAGVEGVNCLIA